MLTEAHRAALEAAWAPARAAGVLGSTTVNELWEHTAGFTSAVCSHFSAEADDLAIQLIDVGTGAGIPGLLLAAQLPKAHITLVDANERRLDHVRRGRRALSIENRCTVLHARAEDLGRDPTYRCMFDAAVARLLADPAGSLELLTPLVRDGGTLVLSAAAQSRPLWSRLPVAPLPLGPAELEGSAGLFVRIPRCGAVPPHLPRREKVRRRQPLLHP